MKLQHVIAEVIAVILISSVVFFAVDSQTGLYALGITSAQRVVAYILFLLLGWVLKKNRIVRGIYNLVIDAIEELVTPPILWVRNQMG